MPGEERDDKTLLLPNYPGCFVCGDENPKGLAVRFRCEGDGVVGDFIPRIEHEGYRGRVHGGVLASLLDEVMAWAPCVRIGRFCVAAEISVRFVRPAPRGVPLRVRGEMTADRKRLCDTKGEIRDDTGTLIARATGIYVPLSAEETAALLGTLSVDDAPATLAELMAGIVRPTTHNQRSA